MPTSSQALNSLRSDFCTVFSKPDWDFRCQHLENVQTVGVTEQPGLATSRDVSIPATGGHVNKERCSTNRSAEDTRDGHPHSSATLYLDQLKSYKRLDCVWPSSAANKQSIEFQDKCTTPDVHEEVSYSKDLIETPGLFSNLKETKMLETVDTKQRNNNRTVPAVSGYGMGSGPSATVYKPLLPGFHSNSNLSRHPGLGTHRTRGHRERSVQCLHAAPSILGRYGAQLVQQLNHVNSGECGAMTLNTDTGRYEWKLLDGKGEGSADKDKRRDALSRSEKHFLPSGLWVSPHENMERRQTATGRSTLPSIFDLTLRVGKGLAVNGVLGVQGKHINLQGNQRSRDALSLYSEPGWLPQRPAVEIHIPSLHLPHDGNCSPLGENISVGRRECNSFCNAWEVESEESYSFQPPFSRTGMVHVRHGDTDFKCESGQGDIVQEDCEMPKNGGASVRSNHHQGSGDTLTCDKQRDTLVVLPRPLPFGLELSPWQHIGGESGPGENEHMPESSNGMSKLSSASFFTRTSLAHCDNGVSLSTHSQNQISSVKDSSSISGLMTFESKNYCQNAIDMQSDVTYRGPEKPRLETCTKSSFTGHITASTCSQESKDAIHPTDDIKNMACVTKLPSTKESTITLETNVSLENVETQTCDKTTEPTFLEDASQDDDEDETSGRNTGVIDSLVIPPPYPKLRPRRYTAHTKRARQTTHTGWEESPRLEHFAENRWLCRFRRHVMRIRKELPPSDPRMLCFQSTIQDCTHAEILSSLESSSPDIKVTSLRYDPIHLQDFRDPAISGLRFKCMWLFKLSPGSDTSTLLLRGFRLRGQRMDVRKADDVYAEERRAFSLCWEIVRRGLAPKNFHRHREPLGSIDKTCHNNNNVYKMAESHNNNNVYRTAERKPARERIRKDTKRSTQSVLS